MTTDDRTAPLTAAISRANLRELAEEAIEGGYRNMEVEPGLVLRLLDAARESRDDGLRAALDEWQQIATHMSDFIIRNGGHPVGKHEAPHQYDSMSVLACTTCALSPAAEPDRLEPPECDREKWCDMPGGHTGRCRSADEVLSQPEVRVESGEVWVRRDPEGDEPVGPTYWRRSSPAAGVRVEGER